MPAFTDQLGRTIEPGRTPSRIVSLVPSQTELLYDLGVNVVGITKFCVHPAAWFHEKPRVGGTKDVHPERVAALKPDLLIANREENDRAQVELLAARYPVWVSDVADLQDALSMIRAVGEVVGRAGEAENLAARISRSFDDVATVSRPLRTAYLIWRNGDPLSFMAVGGDTFIHDMLCRCGFFNVFGNRSRYPTVSAEELKGCDLVLLSSEPYPFGEKDVVQVGSLVPGAVIRLVDGELFSWYGSRLLHTPAYFRELITALG